MHQLICMIWTTHHKTASIYTNIITYLLVSPESNHVLQYQNDCTISLIFVAINVKWHTQFQRSMITRFCSVAAIQPSTYSTWCSVANLCSPCSLVPMKIVFRTVRERHPWKGLWQTVRSEVVTYSASTHRREEVNGNVWVSLGGVGRFSSRILYPAPLHFIMKPNQENQPLSFPKV